MLTKDLATVKKDREKAVRARDAAQQRVAVRLRDRLAGAQCLAPGEARPCVEALVEVGVPVALNVGDALHIYMWRTLLRGPWGSWRRSRPGTSPPP